MEAEGVMGSPLRDKVADRQVDMCYYRGGY